MTRPNFMPYGCSWHSLFLAEVQAIYRGVVSAAVWRISRCRSVQSPDRSAVCNRGVFRWGTGVSPFYPVVVLKKICALFDGFTDNTRGYFTGCVVFCQAPQERGKMWAMSKISASTICNTSEYRCYWISVIAGEVHKLAQKNKTNIFPVRTDQASSIKVLFMIMAQGTFILAKRARY